MTAWIHKIYTQQIGWNRTVDRLIRYTKYDGRNNKCISIDGYSIYTYDTFNYSHITHNVSIYNDINAYMNVIDYSEVLNRIVSANKTTILMIDISDDYISISIARISITIDNVYSISYIHTTSYIILCTLTSIVYKYDTHTKLSTFTASITSPNSSTYAISYKLIDPSIHIAYLSSKQISTTPLVSISSIYIVDHTTFVAVCSYDIPYTISLLIERHPNDMSKRDQSDYYIATASGILEKIRVDCTHNSMVDRYSISNTYIFSMKVTSIGGMNIMIVAGDNQIHTLLLSSYNLPSTSFRLIYTFSTSNNYIFLSLSSPYHIYREGSSIYFVASSFETPQLSSYQVQSFILTKDTYECKPNNRVYLQESDRCVDIMTLEAKRYNPTSSTILLSFSKPIDPSYITSPNFSISLSLDGGRSQEYSLSPGQYYTTVDGHKITINMQSLDIDINTYRVSIRYNGTILSSDLGSIYDSYPIILDTVYIHNKNGSLTIPNQWMSASFSVLMTASTMILNSSPAPSTALMKFYSNMFYQRYIEGPVLVTADRLVKQQLEIIDASSFSVYNALTVYFSHDDRCKIDREDNKIQYKDTKCGIAANKGEDIWWLLQIIVILLPIALVWRGVKYLTRDREYNVSQKSELPRDIDTYEVDRSKRGVTTYKYTKRVGCMWSVLYRMAELVYNTINMQYVISVMYGLYVEMHFYAMINVRYMYVSSSMIVSVCISTCIMCVYVYLFYCMQSFIYYCSSHSIISMLVVI